MCVARVWSACVTIGTPNEHTKLHLRKPQYLAECRFDDMLKMHDFRKIALFAVPLFPYDVPKTRSEG